MVVSKINNNYMKNIIKRIIILPLCTLFFTSQVQAQTSYLGTEKFKSVSGAEYTSGNQPGTVLMKVNLWGAVHRPGIHHIPIKSDLMSLVSYAGGPTRDALLDEVIIKRDIGKTRKLIKVDVEELIKGVSHHHIELAPNDIIVIENDEPLIDQDTLAVVAMISVIMSTILAAAYIDRAQN